MFGLFLGAAQFLAGQSAANEAGNSAEAASRGARRRRREARPLIDRMGRFGTETLDRHAASTPGLEQALTSAATSGPTAEESTRLGIADARQAASVQRGIDERRRGRYGIDPTSGAALAADAQLSLGEARGVVDAANRGRRSAADQTLQRTGYALGVLNRGTALGLDATRSAVAGITGEANANDANAARLGAIAGDAGASAGLGLERLADGLDDWWATRGKSGSTGVNTRYGTGPDGP